MSARLIGELTEWLMSPAAADLTPPERLVLFVVAERAHERTRKMLRHRGDDRQLVDRIAAVTGMSRDNALKHAFQRLAKRGLEVRVPVGVGRNGRPVFTNRGHSMEFVLPVFPASVSLPEGESNRPAFPASESVDNSVDNSPPGPPDGPQGGQKAGRIDPPYPGKASQIDPPSGPKGESNRPALSPSKNYPSNYSPSTSVRSPVAEVEGSPASTDETTTSPRFDLRQALCVLLQVAPEIQAAATEQATAELGPDATNEALRIRAAEIAAKGIPA